jgi:phage baseplate assembly protein gpV
MKLSILGLCLCLAAATAMAAPASQATSAKAQTHKAAATDKAKMTWASGSIEKYDAATKMLTIKSGGKETSFVVTDQVHVMKGKEMLTPSALTAGQHAKVEYSVSGANKEAHVIELSEAKAAPAKK